MHGISCRCGSGQDRRSLVDSAGIFCGYVCCDCVDEVRARYNPAIFTSGSYAATGNESDLEADDYRSEG